MNFENGSIVYSIICSIVIPIVCAIPFYKFWLFMKRKRLLSRYCFNIYDVDGNDFEKKINEIALNPSLIEYVSLVCPQWEGCKNNINLITVKHSQERKVENLQYVLRFLFHRNSMESLRLCGIEMDGVVDVIRAYVKSILDSAWYSVKDCDLCVEMWKNVKTASGLKKISFTFNLHNPNMERKKNRMIMALNGKFSLFEKGELVSIVLPTMLRSIGNLREFTPDMGGEVLYLKGYLVGLG